MGRFDRDPDLRSYVQLRNRRRQEARFSRGSERRSAAEVREYVLQHGGRSLDDILDTLAPATFRTFDAEELYDARGVRYKAKAARQYYVMYPARFDQSRRIRKGDDIRLYTGTSSVVVTVTAVSEDLRRLRSAAITVA